MNQTAIVCFSNHHENTKRLVSAAGEADIFPVGQVTAEELSSYRLIGFASGIYMGKPPCQPAGFGCLYRTAAEREFAPGFRGMHQRQRKQGIYPRLPGPVGGAGPGGDGNFFLQRLRHFRPLEAGGRHCKAPPEPAGFG